MIKASNFSAEPVSSKIKDCPELSITLARNISATLKDSTLRSPLALTLTNINYGRVFIHGFDMSIHTFFTKNIYAEMNASYLGQQEFYNPLTRDFDPINAPNFKINSSLNYESRSGIMANISFRYIPKFNWSAGVFYGTIESYFISDLGIGYKLNKTFSVLANITNIFNDYHREIVGGPELGRHLKFKISTTL